MAGTLPASVADEARQGGVKSDPAFAGGDPAAITTVSLALLEQGPFVIVQVNMY